MGMIIQRFSIFSHKNVTQIPLECFKFISSYKTFLPCRSLFMCSLSFKLSFKQLQFHMYLMLIVNVGSPYLKTFWRYKWINNEALIKYFHISLNSKAGLVFQKTTSTVKRTKGFQSSNVFPCQSCLLNSSLFARIDTLFFLWLISDS